MQPRHLPLASHAASTPTSGSIGAAGLTMSGLSWPGWVNDRPFFMRKRRLKATLSSMPLPTPQRASVRAWSAAQMAAMSCFSTRFKYTGSAHDDFS